MARNLFSLFGKRSTKRNHKNRSKKGHSRLSVEALEKRELLTVVISELHPSGSGNGTYAADWFEVTNTGPDDVNLSGWKMDDSSNSFGSAVALRGVTTLGAGKSAIFFEGNATGTTDATITSAFSQAWFGSATPPGGFLIGAYGGSGVGLSTSGDAVNLFDNAGNWVTGVSFGAASAAATFDNTAGQEGTTVSTLSVAGVNSASLSANGAETGSPGRTLTTVDLSTYIRVGRYDLPEPTRTSAPANSVLAQEVSGITYNWDTDTLFVVGDGGTSVVQITKTGELIDSMTLATGDSPQGTEFYDPEGLTYVGEGKFVFVEERDRQFNLFTYAADTTLNRDDVQTVKLGTFSDNMGIEGLTFDPLTGGFIAVKETQPQGIFHTEVDFAAGTATNGSPTTENSVDLFNPALANLSDFADVFALSNLAPLNGTADYGLLLVLSQESGKIVKMDRSGNIYSSLTIASDPGNPLSVANQQHEGLTMDGNGFLYVVSENGGGDFDHPQLWVYAPSHAQNQAPTAVVLSNQITSVGENSSTASPIKVADILVTDDGIGTNNLSLTGADAASFEIVNNELYLKAGTVLDFETKTSYSVTVSVDDPALGSSSDASANFVLAVTDIEPETPPVPTLIISEIAPWSSGDSPVGADWFELTNTGSTAVDLTGWKMDDSSNTFALAVALSGITSIGAGESVIFIETNDLATKAAEFRSNWFGGNAPVDLQIGSYSGAGVGLSTSGDAINLFSGNGTVQASVSFGAAASGPFTTFNNAAGLNGVTITEQSSVGVNGAFAAVNSSEEIGSPGTIGELFISEVAPWSSGESPVGADWFELTNTTAHTIDLTGWRMDDSSGSFVASVALSGITSIAPGESVIFLETSDLAGTAAQFLTNWFGTNPPAGLQIGSYSGGGVGLSTGGDAIHLYNADGQLQAAVTFSDSPSGPFATFENAAGLNGVGVTLTDLSVAGQRGAFVAVGSASEIGSPGAILGSPNTAPVAENDDIAAMEDTAVTFHVLTNDTDTNGDPLAITAFTSPTNGTVVDNGDGSFTYTPGANFSGGDSFSYTISDGKGGEATAVVNITVASVNDVPTADAKSALTSENVPVSITLSGSDVETLNGNLVFTITSQPQHGTLTVNGAEVVYTPEVGYDGSDSFRYTVTDNGDGTAAPQTSAEAVVAISIASASNQPVVFVGADPLLPGSSALFVYGTSRNDQIEIKGKNSGKVEVEISAPGGIHFDQTYTGSFSRIVVYGQDGNDHIKVDDKTSAGVWIFGGDGNDHLQGGGGRGILMGGAGDDHIQAGRGGDLLIGGTGADHLQAGKGRDILIASTTDYDTNDAALAAILDEWSSDGDYLARIANLQSSSFAYRLTSATVHDDNVSDHLQGADGLDWFFARLAGDKKKQDKVSGDKKGEVTVSI